MCVVTIIYLVGEKDPKLRSILSKHNDLPKEEEKMKMNKVVQQNKCSVKCEFQIIFFLHKYVSCNI